MQAGCYEPLDRGETIRLPVGHGHTVAHVLAVVRYCMLAEGQFSVGAERVDEWLVAPRIAEKRVDEPLVAPKAVRPTEALIEGAHRVLGLQKVKYLDRLHLLAIRQLFAEMIQEKKGRPPKIAAATGAVLAVVLPAMLFVPSPDGPPCSLFQTNCDSDLAAVRSAIGRIETFPQHHQGAA